LVAFLVGLGLPFVGGHLGLANDDPACGPELAAGWGRPVQLQTPAAVQPVQHCAICHLQRATSGAAPAARLAAIGDTGWSDARRPDDGRHVASTALDRQPARAPPASLLS
jgi:hypothetical protein